MHSTAPRYRHNLPQLSGGFFLADGGLETTLVFLDKVDLPCFAAFSQHKTPQGEALLRTYFKHYIRVAGSYGASLILESATWRASADWGAQLGYSPQQLKAVNRRAVEFLAQIRKEDAPSSLTLVVSGSVGPRGDGYNPGALMSEKEAQAYHLHQIEAFADAGADMVCAMTLNYVAEAVGVARAAQSAAMPVAISFTVETDGNLPTGQTLGDAIRQVDAATGSYPVYYMVNCAHPTHFAHVLDPAQPWTARIRGVRANASCRSHAELNEATDLDIGDPDDLAARYAALKKQLPHLNIMGGCCGTDHRHIEKIARACRPLFNTAA